MCISFVRSPLSISRVKNKKNPDLNFEQTKINNNNYHTKGLSKKVSFERPHCKIPFMDSKVKMISDVHTITLKFMKVIA